MFTRVFLIFEEKYGFTVSWQHLTNTGLYGITVDQDYATFKGMYKYFGNVPEVFWDLFGNGSQRLTFYYHFRLWLLPSKPRPLMPGLGLAVLLYS